MYLALGNELLATFAIHEAKKTFWGVAVRLHAIFSRLGSRRGFFIETAVRNLSCHGACSSAALDAFRLKAFFFLCGIFAKGNAASFVADPNGIRDCGSSSATRHTQPPHLVDGHNRRCSENELTAHVCSLGSSSAG